MVKPNGLLKNMDIQKYNLEYHNLNIIFSNSFHDRFIIIDKKVVFHCGTSLNYAGYKTFAINKIEEQDIIKSLINRVLVLN